MAEKKCTKCGETKPLQQFYRMKASKDGHNVWCKSCMDTKRKTWTLENPEREREGKRRRSKLPNAVAAKARYRKHPERIAWMKAYSAKWYAENKDRLKAVRADWHKRNKEWRNADARANYEANREEYWQRNKGWAKANPERMREYTAKSDARRRAQKLGSSGSWNEKDIRRLFGLQRGRCACCREKLNESFHRDHIVALASGGSNDISNIQLLCRSCNSQKHKRDPIAFMQMKGYLL